MTLEGRKAKFEAWKAKVVGVAPYDLATDETFLYFAMKRDANFVNQATEHTIFEGDWTEPFLVAIVRHARKVAAARGYDSVNELVQDTVGIPAWAE